MGGDYSIDLNAIQFFCRYAEELNKHDQKKLVKWLTGSPRLPKGGFKALNPRLTIMKKECQNPNEVLPSVMTCMNYLKLPEYSTYTDLKRKFDLALEYCPHSF